jgi:hypothetical protein
VEANFVLHRLAACQDDAIEVVPERSAVQVRGLTWSEPRRQELRDALARVPHLDIQIRVGQRAAAPSPEVGESSSPGSPPIGRALEQYFAARTPGHTFDLETFKISVLSTNDAVRADTDALHHLVSGFSPHEVDQLPLSSKWLLQKMTGDHLTGLRRNLDLLGSLLNPLPAAIVEGSEARQKAEPEDAFPRSAGSVWKGELLSVCQTVDELTTLIRRLFAGTVPSSTPEQAVPKLLSRLPQVSEWLQRVQLSIAGEFQRASEARPPAARQP